MTNSKLAQLVVLGQSPWMDNVERGMLQSGELASLIEAGEITGLTSNPTIFEKAIGGSGRYDDQLNALLREGTSTEEIYEALATDDIRAVADLLRPVFEGTHRRDGYVSLEVAPSLGPDTAGTVKEAHRLFDMVGRENVMIKVPGTNEGVAAFEQLTAEGVNINVTLLFSVENYEQIARAYLRGLEKAQAAGRSLDRVASVASLFVSRVDTAVDGQLEKLVQAGRTEAADLLGKAAVANAKLAYKRFRQILAEPGWAALAARGAMPQRLLWGSTGTKNPKYSDVLYVDTLIGPDTVNTMPPHTIDAFRDHGQPAVTVTRDVDEAAEQLRRLAALGIDLDAVTAKLQADGLAAFATSFDDLLAGVARKRADLAGARAGA
ncbi:MAG: transaldolase [Chloroflexi bacterium]|nr:transaldolase [Chloroflexota bacterium]